MWVDLTEDIAELFSERGADSDERFSKWRFRMQDVTPGGLWLTGRVAKALAWANRIPRYTPRPRGPCRWRLAHKHTPEFKANHRRAKLKWWAGLSDEKKAALTAKKNARMRAYNATPERRAKNAEHKEKWFARLSPERKAEIRRRNAERSQRWRAAKKERKNVV